MYHREDEGDIQIMASIVKHIPSYVLCTATAFGTSPGVDAWSNERVQTLQNEAVARFHYESRVSAQIDNVKSNEFEFEAIPLVAAQMVRVRFRDIGPLPPMDLEDEICEGMRHR
jgi:hypothetical protein